MSFFAIYGSVLVFLLVNLEPDHKNRSTQVQSKVQEILWTGPQVQFAVLKNTEKTRPNRTAATLVALPLFEHMYIVHINGCYF